MKTILFVPSNENHVDIFSSIYRQIPDNLPTLFISQEPLKGEGAEEAMVNHGIKFAKLQDYKNDPCAILQKEKVGVVVIANDTDVVPQWFVNVATKMKIPSVLIQDGMLFDYNTAKRGSGRRARNHSLMLTALKLMLSRDYRRISYGQSGCTQIHVWGRAVKDYLTIKGVDEHRIIITGGIATQKISRKELATDKRKIILYAPTDIVHSGIASTEKRAAIIQSVISIVSSFENIEFVVKPHPREDRGVYDKLFGQGGHSNTRIANGTENLYDLMRDCDIIVTDISTVAAEGIVAEKSVIIFMPELEKIVPKSNQFPHDLISERAVLYASDDKALQSLMAGLLDGTLQISKTKMAEMAEKYFGPRDSNAAKNSAQAITSLISP